MKSTKAKTGNIIVYIILLVITVAFMLSLKTCSHKRQNSSGFHSAGGDTLDIAIEYSPLSLYTYNDTLGGLNYDIIREIAKDNGLKLKFHPIVSLSEAFKLLDQGIFDILIAEVPMTSEYRKNYLFTEPIYLDRQILVQRKDSITGKPKINSQLDLASQTVWAIANSPTALRIKNLSSEIGDTIIVKSDSLYSSEQLVIMTAIGEIEYAVVNERLARAMAQDYPILDLGTNISFTQFQPWIVSNNDSILCDSLNTWIIRYKQSPQYTDNINKYLK